MKRVILFGLGLIILILFQFGCTGKREYVIEQEVSQSLIFQGVISLRTYVWLKNKGLPNNNKMIKGWIDDISHPNIDSIKCLRYKQANQLIAKIKRLESTNCENYYSGQDTITPIISEIKCIPRELTADEVEKYYKGELFNINSDKPIDSVIILYNGTQIYPARSGITPQGYNCDL